MTGSEHVFIKDGYSFRKEVPSSKMRNVDAKFYVFTKPSLDRAVFRRYVHDDVRSLSVLRPGWGVNSPYRQKLTVAADPKRWVMTYYTFPPEAIAPHLSDIVINPERAHWFPDIFAVHLGLIVNAAVRAVIEELDPDNNYFFPLNVYVDGDTDPLPEARFYWKPRRQLNFTARKQVDAHGNLYETPFEPGLTFANEQLAWELKFNEPVREFIATLPFWTSGPDLFGFGMSVDVFRRLKSEKFTGLLELTSDNRNSKDFDRSHNVGYF